MCNTQSVFKTKYVGGCIEDSTFYGSVMDFLDETFPCPMYGDTDKYEVGTLLHTAVSRFRTNATIIEVQENGLYVVLTDIGNILVLDEKTLKEWYLPPINKRLKEWNI